MERCVREIRKNWEEFGRKDPLWSILPIPEKKDNRWNISDLYQTGVDEINSVINYVNGLNLKINFCRALDFGCGVGRLTQALCLYFEECIGVDISFSMLNIAGKHNNYREKCTYILNCAPHLYLFKDAVFDFIYSNIVLQHLPPDLSLRYIKEFLRIVRKDGLIIFQITTDIVGWKNRVRGYINSFIPRPIRHIYKKLRYKTWGIKDMYYIKEKFLNDFIVANGGKIIDCIEDFSSMPRYRGKRYCITK